MAWLSRIRGFVPSRTKRVEPRPEAVVRAAPGIAKVFEGIPEDGSHSVLDLGPATPASLRVYGRFARRVRFADALTDAASSGESSLLERLRELGEHPFDLVFMWDALARLAPKERPLLAPRLAELTTPGARLHAVVESSEHTGSGALRYMVEDVGSMRYEPGGPPSLPSMRLLPAQMERLLRPFHVLRAFTLMDGLREYVAERGGRPAALGEEFPATP